MCMKQKQITYEYNNLLLKVLNIFLQYFQLELVVLDQYI